MKKCVFKGFSREQKQTYTGQIFERKGDFVATFLEKMHFVTNKHSKMGENDLFLKNCVQKLSFLGKMG